MILLKCIANEALVVYTFNLSLSKCYFPDSNFSQTCFSSMASKLSNCFTLDNYSIYSQSFTHWTAYHTFLIALNDKMNNQQVWSIFSPQQIRKEQ